ncbi:uncharacterized protein EV420DRAFT_1711383 [Desarmillaria tabescens]|uniref:F-box domain-containing protein n=1 Tax=Armillaria tabescens TaxID=1929756 RepID=A0AA39MVX0_ARMTA|nr:uncharacterized protein EV420DRAFT_1711383 [Desarmillaria tabescens]KAK0448996.1 hypothetical protein EV420DRAFT_1711383 [Desarmillaria tabescens]
MSLSSTRSLPHDNLLEISRPWTSWTPLVSQMSSMYPSIRLISLQAVARWWFFLDAGLIGSGPFKNAERAINFSLSPSPSCGPITASEPILKGGIMAFVLADSGWALKIVPPSTGIDRLQLSLPPTMPWYSQAFVLQLLITTSTAVIMAPSIMLCNNCGHSMDAQVPCSPVDVNRYLHYGGRISEAEADLCSNTIVRWQEQVFDYDAEIFRMRFALGKLEGVRQSLIDCIQTSDGLLAPIRRVPRDILQDIFEYVYTHSRALLYQSVIIVPAFRREPRDDVFSLGEWYSGKDTLLMMEIEVYVCEEGPTEILTSPLCINTSRTFPSSIESPNAERHQPLRLSMTTCWQFLVPILALHLLHLPLAWHAAVTICPSSLPVLSQAQATRTHDQFTTSLPTSPLSSSCLLNAKDLRVQTLSTTALCCVI